MVELVRNYATYGVSNGRSDRNKAQNKAQNSTTIRRRFASLQCAKVIFEFPFPTFAEFLQKVQTSWCHFPTNIVKSCKIANFVNYMREFALVLTLLSQSPPKIVNFYIKLHHISPPAKNLMTSKDEFLVNWTGNPGQILTRIAPRKT